MPPDIRQTAYIAHNVFASCSSCFNHPWLLVLGVSSTRRWSWPLSSPNPNFPCNQGSQCDTISAHAIETSTTDTIVAQVHKLCQESAEKLLHDFQPQLMIAIGGGGYVPARILRSFLRKTGSPNIPIQAIGLSLYESLGKEGDGQVEAVGTKVTRTQWLDLSSLGEMANLVGKRILIVDEVDDTRTTLEYAVKELEKDVEAARQRLGGDQPDTEFSIFVLHVCVLHFLFFYHLFCRLPATRVLICDYRTRTRRRRACFPTTWSPLAATTPHERLVTSGSAIPGRRPTSMSTIGWRRSRGTVSKAFTHADTNG